MSRSQALRPWMRLCRAAEYQVVFDQTESRFARGSLVVLTRRNHLEYPRLGLVVRKKNFRLAAERNLIKRLVRENFRHTASSLGGVDLIFMTRHPQQKINRRQLHADIIRLLEHTANQNHGQPQN